MRTLPLPGLPRRQLLLGGATGLASLAGLAGLTSPNEARALPAKTLVFPRDRGAHSGFRTEWWYITGQATAGAAEGAAGGSLFGFQLTFFRSRVDDTKDMSSKFAARQLIFAHAAITDEQGNKLWHDQSNSR